jgi:iron-sulfur cluster assembly protein
LRTGVRVFVEPKAIMHIVGTIMDFVEDDLSSEFVFHNPNATGTCGCGESFTTKEQAEQAEQAHA